MVKTEIQYNRQMHVSNNDMPLVTHTLVDLYCGQGHIEKALEVLEKILLLNPHDHKTIKKIKEIQALVQPLEQYDEVTESEIETNNEFESKDYDDFTQNLAESSAKQNSPALELSELEDISEEDGRRHLMSLIDKNLGTIEIEEDKSKQDTVRQVEEKLTLFLKKIQKRALDYQGSV